jgi:nitrite reductase (NADH) small subunit
VTAVRVGRLEELPAGRPLLVERAATRVAVVRAGDAVYACADACSHRGGPLSAGKVSGTRLACPWHGWVYDVRSGQCLFPGRGAAVPTYPVRVEAGEVWVEMP